ncbi:flagellar hook-length control protein FliK [uncultured Pseudoflavonifractor sp.]|uniref:flagellar hook-length control protein FliK n=1 Tax=uncultured Pseudoflavonifractor sp. TaxID=1221379 RepID=UPI0025E467B2|nr:flagellar hook-length control protein FliK [uncultured Pseudoflavonifractor sp.]
MNVTDMLFQMTLQSQWQVPELSQTTGNGADAGDQALSFQDLLEQQRNGKIQQSKQLDGKGQTETAGKEPVSQDKETEDAAPAELAAMAAGAALLVNCQPQMAQTVSVQAETGAVAAPVQVIAETAGAQEASSTQLPKVPLEADPIQQPGDAAQMPDVEMPSAPVQATGTLHGEAKESDEMEHSAAQELPSVEVQRSRDEEMNTVSVESWQTPLFRKAESMPVRVADAPVDMSAPAQDVEKALGGALKAGLNAGGQHLEIKLTPENLGTVVAEFTRSPEGALHVVLHAETEQTAKLLNSHASALGMMLQDSANGQVKVEVQQPQQSQPFWRQPDQQGQQHHQQQQQQQQRHAMQQESESFLHQLRLGLLQTERV